MLSNFIARFIIGSLPTEKWFRAAFIVSKYYAYLVGPPEERSKNSFRKFHSAKLDALLLAIRSKSRPDTEFPVPIKVIGEELLKKEYPNGLVICGIHIPLVLASVRLFLEQGVVPSAILVKNLPKDGYLYIMGTKVRIPALFTDTYILVKVRSILRSGGIVIILVDDISKEATYFPNIFRLAEKLNSEVLLTLIKLNYEGYIEGHLFELDGDVSAEEDTVKAKIDALHNYVNSVVMNSN